MVGERRKAGRGEGGPGWIATILGMGVLIAAGFVVGIIVGVMSEEPELMVRYWAGQGEEVPWSPDAEATFTDITASEPRSSGDPTEQEAEVSLESVPTPTWEEAGRSLPRAPASVGLRPPATAGGFAVQVGAFSESRAAEDLSRTLAAAGYGVYVVSSGDSGDGRWRVRVGPVASQLEAKELARRLKAEQHLPTWVVSEGGD